MDNIKSLFHGLQHIDDSIDNINDKKYDMDEMN